MMDKLMKLMEKKGKKISPIEQRAKSDVLAKLRGEASDSMGEKLNGLKKVSVAAPDEEGLKAGLDKAKELLGEDQEDDEASEYEVSEPDAAPSEKNEEDMYKDCTPEELQEKIDMLTKLKEEAVQKEQE